jgi:hypothetical protein
MSSGFDLTDEDFNVFVKKIHEMIEIYGLVGWEITFIDRDASLVDRQAETLVDVVGRVATFCLAAVWREEPTVPELKKCAFHEVTEALFFGRLRYLAKSRYVREDEIDEEMHHVVRTMENLLFDADYELITDEAIRQELEEEQEDGTE